jgi:hypothetical protein
MSTSRVEYFTDLITDCTDVAVRAGVNEADMPVFVAALVLCDGMNGLRKALLNSPVSSDRTDRRHSV